MLDSIQRIIYPDWYHGFNKKSNFFEGWYFKNIGEDKTSILSIIPGIIKSTDLSKSHAFIQFIDGLNLQTHYIRFPVEEFEAEKNSFDITIGDCSFNNEKITINIDRPDFKAFGELSFKGLSPWHTSLLSPGVMGWYSFVPFMECNHAIISMNHRVRGKILINNNVYLYTFGNGYIEKDWGKSFPSSYIWMQSNNFSTKDVSFFCSVAKIPWFGSYFRGFICGLMIGNKLYKFATYNRSKIIDIKVTENEVELKLKNGYNILYIKAQKATSGVLYAPYNNSMIEGRVHETLLSEIHIKLVQSTKKGELTLFEETGYFAGLEIVGNLTEII